MWEPTLARIPKVMIFMIFEVLRPDLRRIFRWGPRCRYRRRGERLRFLTLLAAQDGGEGFVINLSLPELIWFQSDCFCALFFCWTVCFLACLARLFACLLVRCGLFFVASLLIRSVCLFACLFDFSLVLFGLACFVYFVLFRFVLLLFCLMFTLFVCWFVCLLVCVFLRLFVVGCCEFVN